MSDIIIAIAIALASYVLSVLVRALLEIAKHTKRIADALEKRSDAENAAYHRELIAFRGRNS